MCSCKSNNDAHLKFSDIEILELLGDTLAVEHGHEHGWKTPSHKSLRLSTEVALVQTNDGNIGAVVSFVGLVRDLSDVPIQKMTLEHYPGMSNNPFILIHCHLTQGLISVIFTNILAPH
jgi:hypothetical protein